jgi:hypothetical protein
VEATTSLYRDDHGTIWSDGSYPLRVDVQPIELLPFVEALTLERLANAFESADDGLSARSWTGYIRANPSRLPETYAVVLEAAISDAKMNPVSTPLDAKAQRSKPKSLRSREGFVTVPDSEGLSGGEDIETHLELVGEEKEATSHTEIQWTILKLGSDMGLDVWAARNDRGRDFKGQRFDQLPRTRRELPSQFDEATNRTIELIDVLWLAGNTIVAAFEIESTTSIYSGLLRMSDLLAMQPNINIPLYLIAPDERRNKVIAEVNRPTFSRLHFVEKCRYISFSTVRNDFPSDARVVRNLKPSFLNEFSESCEIEV